MTLFALALLLLLPPAPASTWSLKQLTCRASCFLTADRLLQCLPPSAAPPAKALPIDCSASQLRDGLRLVIGDYESAQAIAPNGLAIFATSFKDQRLLLRLNVKLPRFQLADISLLLPGLRSLSLLNPPKEPCLFANITAPHLALLEFECLGSDLRRPFELVLPTTGPKLRLKKCALSLECRSCSSRTVAVATTSHHIKLSQRMPTQICPPTPQKQCPVCITATTTTSPPPIATTPTTAVIPSTHKTTSPVIAERSVGAVSALEDGVEPKRRSISRLAQSQAALVKALEKRVARTQNLLIVILCLTLANSFVLIGLCGYFARRRRWSFCGQRKDIYAVAKTAAA